MMQYPNMKTVSSSVVIALGLTLSACNTPTVDNRTLNSVHQPVIERQTYSLDVGVSPGGSLPVQDQRQLTEWFDAMDLGYGDRVSLDDPGGNVAARAMVEAVASRYGLLVSDDAPVTAGQVVPGMMRVIVTRSTAYVPGCPDWASKYENNILNSTSSNFGCATNSNLAAMIADPEDLVNGKDSGSNRDVAGGAKAVQTYRDATPTGSGGLKESSTAGDGS